MAETLGPYTLDKRIGAGGMADVFLANGPSGVCVVKRPHAHLCANPDFVRMFLDEASILASVIHPNIARIFDLGQVNGVYYLAMEYVPGFDLMTISLEHERQGELMAPELCACIIADVAGALHHAHEAKHPKTGQALNLIHRDVSPHNVLLSTTGVVKLIDFGVARASTATHKTQAGLVKGKYPYMAPEQITGQDIDRRVDVYALGLVLYELLTNTRAIAGNTEVEQIDNARAARIRPIEQLRPNLALPLRQILASCVHPDREGRYPTAQALKDDLEKYLRFVGQPIGQEDLLRLFRVVAAEVAHLEPQPAQPLAPGDAQHTWGGARTEQEIPSDPQAPEQPDVGFAPTAPSMRVPAVPPLPAPSSAPVAPNKVTHGGEQPGLAPVPTEPELAANLQSTSLLPDRDRRKVKDAVARAAAPPRETKGPSSTRWAVLAAFAALVVIAAVGLLVRKGPGPVASADDAGAPLVLAPPADAGAVAEVPAVDAGPIVEVPAEDDAGPGLALVEADAGQARDDRAATLDVEADLPMQVRVEGHDWGTTGKAPLRLELTPGAHRIELVNASSFCRRTVDVDLAPGDARAIMVKNPRGTLELRALPGGDFRLNGQQVPGVASMKKVVTVCAGDYSVSVSLTGAKSQTQRARVSAGNVTVVDFGQLQAQ
ncbi:MAG: protein kinase [Myxococcaceae bacterium]|nr:protein kinase [Myxococcaceae bacterium]